MRIGHIRALGSVDPGVDYIQVRFDTLVTDLVNGETKQRITFASDISDPPTSLDEAAIRIAFRALFSEVDGKKGNAKAPAMASGYRDRMPDLIAQMITRIAKEFGLEATQTL